MVAVNSIRTFDRASVRSLYLSAFFLPRWFFMKCIQNIWQYRTALFLYREWLKWNSEIQGSYNQFSKNPCKESRYLRVFQLLWSETGNNSSGYWYCLIRMWIIMLIYIHFLCKGWKFSTIVWARKHECFWTVAFSFIFLAA